MKTAKEKAIEWLKSEAKCHKSADTYDTVDNSFAEDIDYAIDKAILERTKEIIALISKARLDANFRWQGSKTSEERNAHRGAQYAFESLIKELQ